MPSRLPITLAQLKTGNNLINLETIFMNTENSKTSESHRLRLTLADKFNLKDPNKNMVLPILSIYYP